MDCGTTLSVLLKRTATFRTDSFDLFSCSRRKNLGFYLEVGCGADNRGRGRILSHQPHGLEQEHRNEIDSSVNAKIY